MRERPAKDGTGTPNWRLRAIFAGSTCQWVAGPLCPGLANELLMIHAPSWGKGIRCYDVSSGSPVKWIGKTVEMNDCAFQKGEVGAAPDDGTSKTVAELLYGRTEEDMMQEAFAATEAADIEAGANDRQMDSEDGDDNGGDCNIGVRNTRKRKKLVGVDSDEDS